MNAELADLLAELAALLRAGKGDRFRIRAYERAAATLRAMPVDVTTLEESEARRLDGIGEVMARLIADYGRTGGIAQLDELRQAEPPGFGALLRLPLIGVRDARLLAGTHGVADLATLRAGVPGLDERLAGRVRESLRRLDAVAGEQAPMPLARREAEGLHASLARLPGVEDVLVAGGLRRGDDTVDGYDLVLVGDRPAEVADALPANRAVVRVLARDDGPVTVLAATGRRALLWPVTPKAAGAGLLWATGPGPHVAALRDRATDRGLELRPDGLWEAGRHVAGHSEEEVYAALGLPPIPPELREAQLSAAPPRLVELADLRGDLHVHSDWSRDGRATLDQMVAAAAARGYRHVALTDHAENLAINGMPREAVRARRRAIGELQERYPGIRLLDAVELNIGLDGSLDYDLEFLLEFDLGVASVHSHMDQPAARQTERTLTAIAHPAVHVIGHPTGRIIGHRPGYGIDLEAIAQAAAETGTALEVNGSPRRLDLAPGLIRVALRAGATIALSSDAHAVRELDYVEDAVRIARRGGATPEDVLNCRDMVLPGR